MLSRRSLLVAFCLTFSGLLAAREPIVYTLGFDAAAQHYVDVEAEIPTEGKDELTLFMPVWTPGSYLVREYSGNIVTLEATRPGDDTELPAEKISKNRWQVPVAGLDRVRLRYRLFAREINVRNNWVESDFAVINGAPTFITVADDYQRPYEVRLVLPTGWATSHTPLPAAGRPHAYTAPDFDTLVDSPIIAGSPQVDDFTVDGVRHTLVTLGGGGVWDNARMAANLERLVVVQRDFWGRLPYDQPYYFFNLLTGSRGGLEHRQSLTITADRWLSRTRGGVRSWLSLASHEFFHVWNGKRLRPVELGPFAYEHENYTKSLWIVEGLTSYYQHLILTRAGYTTRDQYLGALSGSLAGVQRTPGRLVQSLSDSSFDAWVKAYRPNEDAGNSRFSYYGGGAVAGFLIDAKIRQSSGGTRSLDDVMRAAYDRYSGDQGYTEAEFIALASEIAGQDLTAWFRDLVQTPGEWDYQPALDWFGLQFESPKPPAPPDANAPDANDPTDAAPGWLGADTSTQNGRVVVTRVPAATPAATAGLSVDDEIIALDQHRVGPGELDRLLRDLGANTRVDLHISRHGLLHTLPVTLGEAPTATWRLEFAPDATTEQKERVDRWLASDVPVPVNPTPPSQ